MKILAGIDIHSKLHTLAGEIVNKEEPVTIITENKEFVEDIFFEHTDILMNIEIKTLREFQKDLLIKNHIFNRHLLPKTDFLYLLRSILSNHSFSFFKLNTNPYPLLKEIMHTIEIIHQEKISFDKIQGDSLTIRKCQELSEINNLLMKALDNHTFITYEEMIEDLLKPMNSLYILADSYPHMSQRDMFKKLNSVLLLSYDNNDHLESYQKDFYLGDVSYTSASPLSLHLFDIEEVEKIEPACLFIGGHPILECMKVTSDIKEKLYKEKLHYHDFMIIAEDPMYLDYLKRIFNEWDFPHDIATEKSFYYDENYQRIEDYLHTHDIKCSFNNHIHSLLKLSLSSDYINYLNSIRFEDLISSKELLLYIQETLSNQLEVTDSGDFIHVTSFKNACSIHKEYIYFMGLNEGCVPQVMQENSLLLEEDLISLNHYPLSLSKRLGEHHLHIIHALSNPHKQFFFSYSQNSLDGKELMPSTLMKRLYEFFIIKESKSMLPLHTVPLYLLGGRIDNYPINNEIDHYKASHNNTSLIDEKYRNLLGKGMSISRLDIYNQCPFQYYIRYGLKIYPSKEDSLLPNELGSLCHYIMEKALDDYDHLTDYGYQYVAENLSDKYQNPLNQYLIDHLIEDMKLNVKIVLKQLNNSKFIPIQYEEEVKGKLGEIPVQGYIDRLDQYKKYIRIIEYKSSNKEINLSYAMQGFNIQMLVYLDLYTQKHQLKPGSVLYYSMKKQILNKQLSLTDNPDSNTIYKAHQMTGYVIDQDDYPVMNASDPDSIPVAFKRDGTPSKNSKIISEYELKMIIHEITSYINELYSKLKSGDVSIYPAKSNESSYFKIYACRYCDYASVCLYDVFENKNKDILSDYKKDLLKGAE